MTVYDSIISYEPINKGWSADTKYCAIASDGTKYLLRITPMPRGARVAPLFRLMAQVSELGVPICEPVEHGVCDDGVYALYSWVGTRIQCEVRGEPQNKNWQDKSESSAVTRGWIDGVELREVLPAMSEVEQYVLGVKAGEYLRKIHTIPAQTAQEDWASCFNRKIDTKVSRYESCGLRFNGDEYIFACIDENRHLLVNRPRCFQHGDFHEGNFMLDCTGNLVIIDFDKYDFGDPWEEFNRIVWSASLSPHFATGQLNSYFNGEPPEEFFRLMALYIACNTLSHLPWAIPFGQRDVDVALANAQNVLRWYDNMRNVVPNWYLGEM